jgi:hypothetical protein
MKHIPKGQSFVNESTMWGMGQYEETRISAYSQLEAEGIPNRLDGVILVGA